MPHTRKSLTALRAAAQATKDEIDAEVDRVIAARLAVTAGQVAQDKSS